MKIADKIIKTTQTLEERGIPNDSYFEVIFEDGSEINEKEANWSSFSEKKEVSYLDIKKIVRISKFPVKNIKCFYKGLNAEIEVPKDCQAYQAIRSNTTIVPTILQKNETVGRIIGIIRNNEVIEEKFLNGIQFRVEGIKNNYDTN